MLALRFSLAACFLGSLPVCLGSLRLFLELALLLRLVATLPLDHGKLLLLLVALRDQLLLFPFQRIEPPGLRFALAREFREALRLLALTFPLGRHVLPLALALQPFELLEPALLLGAPALGGIGFAFELLYPVTLLPSSLLVLFAQTREFFANLLLVDDHGFDRFGPRARHDRRRRISEPEDEHRRDDGMENQRVDDGKQPMEQRVPAHCGASRGDSVISPTLGAPARCRIVIRRTTSP